jgi:hypothetical protein
MNNMKNEQPTYTLWNGSNKIADYPHTREGMDAAMEQAHNLTIGGYLVKLTIYSSRDDIVWSSSWDDGPECGMSDVEADADTLASAGYGTDEDYGFYGEDCQW